jgi:ABC-2 type transport system permease protein
MKALYFKEIRSFLSSIIGYTFILIFLITSGLFHWVISDNTNLLEGAEADLIPFFQSFSNDFFVINSCNYHAKRLQKKENRNH